MIDYSLDEMALIFLSHFEFMTFNRSEKILSLFDNPKDLLSASKDDLQEIKQILKEYYDDFYNEYANLDINNFCKKISDKNVSCLTRVSKGYPEKLTYLKNPPLVLYYYGNLDLLNTKSLAIVGTRNPSNYGKMITEKFAKEIAKNGVTIISGLAEGVDGISHRATLEVEGNTIAVLGGGFDHLFPEINTDLARQIAKKGLVLTEYYMPIKATKYTFPARNRIIAALSDLILIPEAKAGSGSLYTKDFGDSVGVETFCIPGNITSENSYATNNLIKCGEAGCATCPEDILMELGIIANMPENDRKNCKSSIKQSDGKLKSMNLTAAQAIIYNLLLDGEHDFDFLQEKTNYDTQTLNYNLTTMEISGIIKKLAGNMYTIAY